MLSMRIYFRRVLALGIAAAMAATSLVPSAMAESVFLLQLGSAANAQEAQALFEQARERYPRLLGRYNFYPREMRLLNERESVWRAQAGPVESRTRAYKLCAEMKAQGSECFVVESATFAADTPAALPPLLRQDTKALAALAAAPDISASSATRPVPSSRGADIESAFASLLPWNWFDGEDTPAPQTEPAEAAQAAEARTNINTVSMLEVTLPKASPETEAAGADGESAPTDSAPEVLPIQIGTVVASAALPWLQAETAPAVAVSDAPSASSPSSAEGNVEVAEAIPVPLTADRAPPPSPASARLTRVTSERIPFTQHAAARRVLYWMQIGPFPDAPAALSCWQIVRQEDGALEGLRAQTLRSYFYRGRVNKTMLRVGPLADAQLSERICGLARRCGAASLTCRNVSEMPNTAQTLPAEASPSAGESADQPARAISGGTARSGNSFWVQLGSAPTYRQAAERWKSIQAEHASLLGRREALISAPAASGNNLARPAYRIRLGAFNARMEADLLCNRLAERQVSCLVVSE